MPWSYPQPALQGPPQTPPVRMTAATQSAPEVESMSSQPETPTAGSKSFPPTQDLKEWCLQHSLGEAEYQGLLKLGFHVDSGRLRC
jgi:hypothetical protein